MRTTPDFDRAFFDGECPKCKGHTRGTPLHCEHCGWTQTPESAARMKAMLDDIFRELFPDGSEKES